MLALSNKRMWWRVWCIAALCAVVLTQAGCASKGANAVALPFAVVGDTVVLPFQALGYASEGLIASGDASNYRYTSRWGYQAVTHRDTPLAYIFYIPGYALMPFVPFTHWDMYAMTRVCHENLTAPRPYRRRRVRY